MRFLTVLFATLFLMGCPENDSATTEDAATQTQQDAAGNATDTDAGTDATTSEE